MKQDEEYGLKMWKEAGGELKYKPSKRTGSKKTTSEETTSEQPSEKHKTRAEWDKEIAQAWIPPTRPAHDEFEGERISSPSSGKPSSRQHKQQPKASAEAKPPQQAAGGSSSRSSGKPSSRHHEQQPMRLRKNCLSRGQRDLSDVIMRYP